MYSLRMSRMIAETLLERNEIYAKMKILSEQRGEAVMHLAVKNLITSVWKILLDKQY